MNAFVIRTDEKEAGKLTLMALKSYSKGEDVVIYSNEPEFVLLTMTGLLTSTGPNEFFKRVEEDVAFRSKVVVILAILRARISFRDINELN